MSKRRFGYERELPSGKFQASYAGPDGGRHIAPTPTRFGLLPSASRTPMTDIGANTNRFDRPIVLPAKANYARILVALRLERHLTS